jgi:hypothetical protein
MKVISKAKTSRSVKRALQGALKQVNKELEGTPGVITKLECEISLTAYGAYVSIMTTVNGEKECHKEVLGVNIRGGNRDRSLIKAAAGLNELLGDNKGEIVDMYSRTVAPLPGRVYTTMIAAINCESEAPFLKNTTARRGRIKKTLELLGNSPATINIAHVAEILGVSRSIIYRDLEALGFERAGMK